MSFYHHPPQHVHDGDTLVIIQLREGESHVAAAAQLYAEGYTGLTVTEAEAERRVKSFPKNFFYEE